MKYSPYFIPTENKSLVTKELQLPNYFSGRLYKQAQSVGAQVRKGEKGTQVQYWKFSEKVPALDKQNKPIIGSDGKEVMVDVKLDKPKVFSAVVFNASQVEGLPELKQSELKWNPVEKAEAILKSSGAKIFHDQESRAFYNSSRDEIHLPQKSQFTDASRYYATALHELGHWTGHSTRLARELNNPFGSEAYAREELRAEIGSMMMGAELGLGHDPGSHVAYIDSWIQVLEKDPREIFRASSDAEKIMSYVLGLERDKELNKTNSQKKIVSAPLTDHSPAQGVFAKEKTYLAVPFKEKNQAKVLGARWDVSAKSWYIPAGEEISKFDRWKVNPVQNIKESPKEEFKKALEAGGLLIDGLPIMDGTMQRVSVSGGNRGNRDGAYVGYLDGHPAGFIQNFKTGEKSNWRSKGYSISAEEKARLTAEAAQKKERRASERLAQQKEVAEVSAKSISSLHLARENHFYLKSKGVQAFGIKEDPWGKLQIPARDIDGKIWSVVSIDANGDKRFRKGSRKTGCFYAIGDQELKSNPSSPVILAEGFATAASIYQSTGIPTVAAFDSGNLKAVAEEFRKKYPSKQILICGDDDKKQERENGKNPGKQKALAAAKAVGGRAVFPVAPFSDLSISDFNDLARKHGPALVKRQLEVALKLSRSEPSPEKIQHRIEVNPKEKSLGVAR